MLVQRVVVGNTGSGKSTFAVAVAARLGGDFVDIDALNWGRTGRRPGPPPYGHLRVYRFRRPAGADVWLRALPRTHPL